MSKFTKEGIEGILPLSADAEEHEPSHGLRLQQRLTRLFEMYLNRPLPIGRGLVKIQRQVESLCVRTLYEAGVPPNLHPDLLEGTRVQYADGDFSALDVMIPDPLCEALAAPHMALHIVVELRREKARLRAAAGRDRLSRT